MLRNDIILAFRNMTRQKGYTFINVAGLSIGFLCAVFIALWIKSESNYDRFHEHSDQIYRVYMDTKFADNEMKVPISCVPLGETMKESIPEIEQCVRIIPFGNRAIQYKDKIFYEDNFFLSDPSFFDIFTVNFVKGSPVTALASSNQVVITEQIAQKYFGNTNPIGKTLRINNSDSTIIKVSGVIKPFPENSHLNFDFLCSIGTFPLQDNNVWLSLSCITYFLLNTASNPDIIEEKINRTALEYLAPQVKEIFGHTIKEFVDVGNHYTIKLQPIEDIHLKSHLQYELSETGDLQTVQIFLVVGILILVIAGINFTNLSTAKYSKRIKEVGIKKTVGADRKYLFYQFISESMLLSAIALFFSFILAELLIPVFNDVFDTELYFLSPQNADVLLFIVIIAVIVGFLSGLYPALFLSSFSPVKILKSSFNLKKYHLSLRNGLVVFQFIMSFLVILGTSIIVKQLRYIKHKGLGFDSEKVIVIERTDPIKKQVQSFMDELKTLAGVENVALTNGIPGRDIGMAGFMVEGRAASETHIISFMRINDSFVPTIGLKLKQGRNFSSELAGDSLAVIINETAAKDLGLVDPVGKYLITPGTPEERTKLGIVGVVQDFHFRSLHDRINPIMFFHTPEFYDGYITVRIAGNSFKPTINNINETWNAFAPGFPMVHFFFDKEFEKHYQAEKQTSRILSFFAIISVFISCLGLLGLTSYTCERKTKEIGIRKAVGANETSIVYLLSKGFLKWVIIAVVIASPVALLWSEQWLSRFAYKTNISWWIYIFAGLLTLIIAQISVIYQALRAALKNPVTALRYE